MKLPNLENWSSSELSKSKSNIYVKNNANLSDYLSLYFLKFCPIFYELALSVFSKYIGLLWVYWFLAKNLAFQNPPSLKFHNQTDITVLLPVALLAWHKDFTKVIFLTIGFYFFKTFFCALEWLIWMFFIFGAKRSRL